MKTQLIMLDIPIIVSGEQIKEGDNYYSEGEIYLDCEDSEAPLANLPEQNCNKIIAGIAGLPTINWNGLEEEFGYDKFLIKCNDLETQSFEGWSDDSISGYLTALITLKKQYQSLNEKKFSLEDILEAIKLARYGLYNDETNPIWDKTPKSIIQSLQQPKVFDIEVEKHFNPLVADAKFKPKITNNSIKIIKKL